jgi:DNA-binding transcriptional MerR regulator
MDAWFDMNYTELSKEEFDMCYAEYQDTSGLFMSEDFERISYIQHLNQRINYVKMFLRLQREFLSEFDKPFTINFEQFKDEYGYVLKWRDDKDDFENQLKNVERREQKHHSYLEDKIKELNDLRKQSVKLKSDDPEDIRIRSRSAFIRMLNSLGKIGYKLDKFTTTVEELSLMIKQQFEDIESQKRS